MEKKFWPSQWIFILAAIGSAAGIGNLWRFPALAYEHGGGAFVVAIIVANLVIGIPLLILEVGFGQMTQKAAPDAFARIKKSFRYLGWSAVVLAFFVLAYYMAVVSWGVNYFAASFSTAWVGGAEAFFFGDVLQISDSVGQFGGIVWPVIGGLLIAWLVVYFCVWRGVQSVSHVVKWSATIPFAILFILLIRAVTLPGSGEGIAAFLVPQWSALASPQLWLAAFSQVFFSLSIAFGVMIAYGSLNRKDFDVTNSVLWIAGGNFLVSILSGLVIFGTLGYMAFTQGVGIADVVAGGPGLAFVVFPEAISLMPAFNALIGILFFGTFLMLAVDSAFSLLEGIAVAVRDRLPHVSSKKIAATIAVVCAAVGLIYATHAGLYVLDITDHFIVNYGVVLIGLIEAIVIGWLWKSDDFLQFVNEHATYKIGNAWLFAIRFIIPLFLGILLIVNVIEEFKQPYEGYPVWALIYLGVLPVLLAPVIGIILDRYLIREE